MNSGLKDGITDHSTIHNLIADRRIMRLKEVSHRLRWVAFPAIGIGSYLWLLSALFLLFIVAPWLSEVTVLGIRLSDLLCLLILMVGISAVSRSKIAFLVLSVLAICSIVPQFMDYYTSSVWTGVAANGAAALFLLGLFMIIAFDVFGNREVTMETLAGACCGYVLIAGIFAAIYSIMLLFNHDAISLWENAGIDPQDIVFQERGWGILGYYSIATLTTLGYGDIVPNSTGTRSMAVLEAVIGQLYLAVIVARLVGMYRFNRPSSESTPMPSSA